MDSGSAPQQPDPYATAQAQGQANKDAAITTAALNRPNQHTPYGSLIWEQGAPTKTFNEQRYQQAVEAAQKAARIAGYTSGSGRPRASAGGYATEDEWGVRGDATDPGAGSFQFMMPDRNDASFYDETPSTQWSSRIELDPRVQALLDAQLETSTGLQGATDAALQRVLQTFGQGAPTPNDEMRQRVEDSLYGRYTSRLDPQFQSQENTLRTNLMNRGIVEGSEAWRTAMDNFGRQKNDAYSTAMQDATYRGGQEMSNLYGMEMAGRNAVLNELNALRSGQQVSTPQFGDGSSGAQVNPAPIAQSMYNNYQGQLGMYNADVASNNATMGAGMGAMASIAAAFI